MELPSLESDFSMLTLAKGATGFLNYHADQEVSFASHPQDGVPSTTVPPNTIHRDWLIADSNCKSPQ